MFDVEPDPPRESLLGAPDFLVPRLHQTTEDEENEDEDAENITKNDIEGSHEAAGPEHNFFPPIFAHTHSSSLFFVVMWFRCA